MVPTLADRGLLSHQGALVYNYRGLYWRPYWWIIYYLPNQLLLPYFQGGCYLYSLSCRELVFSETHSPLHEVPYLGTVPLRKRA